MIGKPSKKLLPAALALILIGAGLLAFAPKSHAPQAEPNREPKPKTTTLFFAGDIMLSRNVAAKMYAQNDFTLPFAGVKDEIASADISFANLESPFNDTGDHSVEGSLVFNADPQSVTGLTAAGFDILSTANNHAFDQGKKGIEFTKAWLAESGIIPIGTGTDCHEGKVISKNGIRFGFLAYSYTAYNSGTNQPDPLVCDAYDLPQVGRDIKNLKTSADIVFVSVHAGTEYTLVPNEFQTNLAHHAVDSGADFIIGAHPHWVQKIEQYKGHWIFYSLGNFVFDQMWSTETRQGMAVKVTYRDQSLDRVELMPLIIDNYCCTRWAQTDEKEAILKRLDLTNPVIMDKND